MWADAVLIAGKDLRIEARSKVTINHIVPFALVVLVLFAIALDPDRGILDRTAPGLFWVVVLFASLFTVQRSASLESGRATRDVLRMSTLDPAGIFLGKTAAVVTLLFALEIVLAAGVAILYDAELANMGVLVLTCVLATVGLSAMATLYGVLASGARLRETLVPLLVLPVAAPVLLCATRATESVIVDATADAWPWLRLLGVFALTYVVVGVLAYGSLMEDA